MSQIFDSEGNVIAVTLIKVKPCEIFQIKTKKKDGYDAIVLGFDKVKKEFRTNPEQFKVGQKISLSQFKEGDKVSVSGLSKGKGFAGVVKRWAFGGKSASHGTKHEQRSPGAIGAATPHRVIKGKKMAGRLGGERVTIFNLKIAKIDEQKNILALKGAVPGPKNSILEIRG